MRISDCGLLRAVLSPNPHSAIRNPKSKGGEMRRSKSENKRERGSVLAMSALGMLTFLLATGMAVDLGHFYLVKSELQNAADAAALAGASALNSGPTGIQRAQERATAAMNNYDINSKGLKSAEFVVTYSASLNGGYMSYGS